MPINLFETIKPASMRSDKPPGFIEKRFSNASRKVVAELPSGTICDVRLERNGSIQPIPDTVQSRFDMDPKYAKKVMLKMTQNAGRPFPLMLAKPSSAYIMQDTTGNYTIRYLIEGLNFKRETGTSLHTYLYTEHRDQEGNLDYDPSILQNLWNLWSGHLALLTQEFRKHGYKRMFLLDKIRSQEDTIPTNNDTPEETATKTANKRTVEILRQNGILAVDAKGRLIYLDSELNPS